MGKMADCGLKLALLGPPMTAKEKEKGIGKEGHMQKTRLGGPSPMEVGESMIHSIESNLVDEHFSGRVHLLTVFFCKTQCDQIREQVRSVLFWSSSPPRLKTRATHARCYTFSFIALSG